MACVSGTNIVNDGLVFHFDLENSAKSWKGKPTSNLIANPIFSSGTYSPWSYQTTSNGNAVLDTTVKYQGYNSVRITRTSTGGETNVWTNMSAIHGLLPNTEYTFSVWCLANNPNEAAIFTYFGTTSEGFVYHSGSGEWERLSHTFTTRATEPYIQLRMWHDTTTLNSSVWFTKLQVEEGPIASKWTNGVRLDTASIVDVSPTQSTITAANLTYRQDDTPTFDGTNDYLVIPSDLGLTASNFTCEAMVKFSATGDINSFFSLNYSYPSSGYLIRTSSNSLRIFSDNGSEYNLLSNWNFSINTFYHIMVTQLNGIASIYINGELDKSASLPNPVLNTTIESDLGRRGPPSIGAYLYGEIGYSRIYNRALTAQEVKQNFEATRTRYGI